MKKRVSIKRARPGPRAGHQPLAEKLAQKRARLAATHRTLPKPARPLFSRAKRQVERPPPRLYLPKLFWRSAASLLAPERPSSSARESNKASRAARKLRALSERETRAVIARDDADRRDFQYALRAYNNELARRHRVAAETELRAAALAADDEAHKAKAAPVRPLAAGRYAALRHTGR